MTGLLGLAATFSLFLGLTALYGFAWTPEEIADLADYAVRAGVDRARQGYMVFTASQGRVFPSRDVRLAQGTASWYGEPYHGRRTASGTVYNMHRLTAAHQDLPFNTRIKVTNLDNGRSVVLKIDDRGPFIDGRIVDVSFRAAQDLGMVHDGLADVQIATIPAEPGS